MVQCGLEACRKIMLYHCINRQVWGSSPTVDDEHHSRISRDVDFLTIGVVIVQPLLYRVLHLYRF